MRDVSIGQYYPVKSVVHQLDPRTKLILVVAYIVMLFFVPTPNSFLKGGGSLETYVLISIIVYAMIFCFILMGIKCARVPFFKVLRSIRAIIYLVIITAIITLLFYGGEAQHVYASWWIIEISLEGIITAIAMALRLFFLVLGPSLLTLTTTPVELTDGLEKLLKPLSYIKIPVHEIAIIMSIALRLIPTLMEETEKIKSAQKARCADFDSGNIFKRAKAMLPILIPLLVSSFRRADDLADAMDSRCYHGAKGRTRMKVLKFHLGDLVAVMLIAVLFFALLTVCNDYFGLTTLLAGWIL